MPATFNTGLGYRTFLIPPIELPAVLRAVTSLAITEHLFPETYPVTRPT